MLEPDPLAGWSTDPAEDDDAFHIRPTRDAWYHRAVSWCWCVPYLATAVTEDGMLVPVWVHNARDGRA